MADQIDQTASEAAPKHEPHTTTEIAEFLGAVASASTALEGLLAGPPGLTIAQWKTLARIEEDPASASSPAKMARNLSMTPQAVRRSLKKLVELDFAEQEGEGTKVGYKTAPAGKAALDSVNAEFARIAAELSERRGALRFGAATKTIQRSLTFITAPKASKDADDSEDAG